MQTVAKPRYTEARPKRSTVGRNSWPTVKLEIQWVSMAKETPLPRTEEGRSSGIKREGTGPAPMANPNTYAKVPTTASTPLRAFNAGQPIPIAMVAMEMPMMAKELTSRGFLPARSIILPATTVPSTLTRPTTAEAVAPEVIPARSKTAVEKNTMALIPANCCSQNNTAPFPRALLVLRFAHAAPQLKFSCVGLSAFVWVSPSSASASSPHRRLAATKASSSLPTLFNHLGDSGMIAQPASRIAAGTIPKATATLHPACPQAALTTSAPKIPVQMANWLRLPNCPRS
eukprot:scaffold2028_cov353-Pavlova_lutheri.AAC.4